MERILQSFSVNTPFRLCLMLCILVMFCFTTTNAQDTILAKSSTWNYLDDGTDPGATWLDSGFNDGSWASGAGILGYGTLTEGAITTTVDAGPKNNQYATYYFRTEVTLTDPSYTNLIINLLGVDGVVLYINETEVINNNMPGTWDNSTFSSSNIGNAEEVYSSYSRLDTYFKSGINTIAVEVHAASDRNKDLGFDLEILGVDYSHYILPPTGEWYYLDDGTNQGTSWRDSGFDHSSWASGGAILGYGTLDGASITTTVSYGSDAGAKYPTTYFRKEVTVTNPDFDLLKITLLADDGAIIYINGKKAVSLGMPGTYDYLTYANKTAAGLDEGDYETYIIPDSFLVNGVNTFAAEIHQVNASSSDLGFDMTVEGMVGTVVNGEIFLDLDGNGILSGYDTWGSGAIEIRAYNDADSNGIYTDAEIYDSYLTNPHGDYTLFVDTSVRHLVIKLMTEDMDEVVEYTTDTVYTYTIDASSPDTLTYNFGQLGPRSLCLLIADDQSAIDEYYIANRITGKNKFMATIEGRDLIEALAIRIGMDSMWACDEGQFGSVDIETGVFTPIGTGIGSAVGLLNGSVTSQNLNDIDGMAYDGLNDLLYGVHRMNGSYDLLFVIDRATGSFVDNHFGVDRDFVKIKGTSVMHDVDDIAFNPFSGQLLAVNNSGNGDSARYITIDPSDGSSTVISIVGVGDFEGIGYYNTGELYGTTGIVNAPGYADNTFYQIDRNTGVGTRLDTLYSGAIDVEACDCLTGPTENLISGVVFYDNDSSGTYESEIDSAYGSILLYLYRDANGNGVIDSGDYIIDSTYTNPGTGFYVFLTDSLGDFLMRPVIDGTPLESNNTTTGDSITEDATFSFHGDFDGKNDFGFHISSGQPYLPVSWLGITAEWIEPDDALVKWTTGSEVNSSHFIVERKVGEGLFSPIGKVRASGNSNESTDYYFDDFGAKLLASNILHYRIRQVDYNGKSELSEVVSLQKQENNLITVYPNPVNDVLNINLNAKGDYQVSIIDMVGNEVLSLNGYNKNKFSPIRIEELNLLTRGMYLVRITYNGEDTIVKLIK